MTTGFIHANTCKYLVGNYRKLGPKIANCFGHPQNNFELTVKASSLLDLCLQGLLETAVVRVFHFLKLGFVCVCVCVSASATPWTADQPSLSMGFLRQEHWSGL